MKKFQQNDNTFICCNCKKHVNKLGYTSRNHCPYCLYSLHVDLMPGDRACLCKGAMRPIGYIKINGKDKILHRCMECGKEKNNIVARDDDVDRIIELSTQIDS